jgi:formylglycine-generating enzyme required for sulfatase activity
MKKYLLLIGALVMAGGAFTQSPDMVRINGGTFVMGSPAAEWQETNKEFLATTPTLKYDERQHYVTVSSFYIGKYEVTQREWRKVMGRNPSHFKGEYLPVETISWYDAVEYCNKRSEREGLTPVYSGRGDRITWNRNANGYRLPTEAEWEYACRAGTTTPYYTGTKVDGAGWYIDNSGWKTHPVGQKQANAWGLYDMHGNVLEWCWDWYGEYPRGDQIDPTGAGAGASRVVRGGSWNYIARLLRSALRDRDVPADRNYDVGFRLARSASGE